MNNNIVISLGTNLGSKESNLNQAILLLNEFLLVTKKSNIYLSEPWGYSSENSFLNCGLLVSTKYEPLTLLKYLKEIEFKMGRKFLVKDGYQDRIIDLDILIYNDLNYISKDLTIPHSKIKERKFAIYILRDIFQNEKIPGLSKSASLLLEETTDKSELFLYDKTNTKLS